MDLIFLRYRSLFFRRLGDFIARYPASTIAIWMVLAVLAILLPPRWDDVTLDGDLEFLPADMPSVAADRLYRRVFPERQSKSQLVFTITRAGTPLTEEDLQWADRLASPLQNALGVSIFEAADAQATAEARNAKREEAIKTWDEAALLDPTNWRPLWNLAYAQRQLGNAAESSEYRAQAIAHNAELGEQELGLVARAGLDWHLHDVVTRHAVVRGEMLHSKDKHAVLVVVETRNEFMATDNIRVLNQAADYVEFWRAKAAQEGFAHLEIGVTGNAAIGGDMLRSAQESIRNTELYTILLVIVILLVIYRAPLILIVPMVSIAASFIISSWLVALLTQLHELPGWEWAEFKVFKTSRIFIVVILFGAGTDFCLFLIGRYREELGRVAGHQQAIQDALAGVGEAITASALTTVVGLGMMAIADFEKYRNSGPTIGLCLLVTLLTCLTLAPAIICLLGDRLFWPWSLPQRQGNADASPATSWWGRISVSLVRYPGMTLLVAICGLGLIAGQGIYRQVTTGRAVDVSYDLFGDLGNDRLAKRTALRLQQHFPLGENGPINFLAANPQGDFESPDGKALINRLAQAAFDTNDDVQRVFTSQQPTGTRSSGFSFSGAGRRRMLLKSSPRTQEYFLGEDPELGNIALFRVVTNRNPFSPRAIALATEIQDKLQAELNSLPPPWNETTLSMQGTTPSIRDLMLVTSRDQRRIEWSVILAVFAVLLVILRRPIVCAYMILSVLLSYFVTLSITEQFFRVVYADSFHALDWKLPLFLFVILAAVGQDYNVYLATRVFEEQAKHGKREGLLRGIASTGGIITSCGIVMAGTFASMCMGTLLGVIEIGFALAVGILLDTFVVRTVLLPCFLALLDRAGPEIRP